MIMYVECGSCGHFHRPLYWGDCRNNDERFSADDLNAKHGPEGKAWDYIEIHHECDEWPENYDPSVGSTPSEIASVQSLKR